MSDPRLVPIVSATELNAALSAVDAAAPLSDDETDAVLEHLVAAFEPEQLANGLRQAVERLDGSRGDIVLRLAEALGDDSVLARLAATLMEHEGLSAERRWEALAVLEHFGRLEHEPELADQWAELEALLDQEDATIDELVTELESDPDDLDSALAALDAVEPEIRGKILAELANRTQSPAVLRFLDRVGETMNDGAPAPPLPATRFERSLSHSDSHEGAFTAIDRRGIGTILLGGATDRGEAVALFTCDVRRGITQVVGRTVGTRCGTRQAVDEFVAQCDEEPATDAGTAAALLAAAYPLDPSPPEIVEEWVRVVLGNVAGSALILPGFTEYDSEDDETPRQSALRVLRASDCWLVDSAIVREIAVELQMRPDGGEPDPDRDVGAYRFLFEHVFLHELELDRRKLEWMTAFWAAVGDRTTAHCAWRIAAELAVEENATPAHPFLVERTTLSLLAAQRAFRRDAAGG